ncbi:MAG: hypothetical protein BWY69_01547 [Planctomycetes bacterium ADurb.Bin401]|nr:MAG: hypothetical protein BWY69_01547 [Planctomycetes bacterium ADurb.Bin401]
MFSASLPLSFDNVYGAIFTDAENCLENVEHNKIIFEKNCFVVICSKIFSYLPNRADEKEKYKNRMKQKIFTIGHSTHTLEEFISILDKYEITKLVDVRSIPKSRHNPQFNKENMQAKLRRRYIHLPGLGGLRHTTKDSPNTGWKNPSFRGYADYMQTEAFEKNMKKLLAYVQKKQVAIMCAEAVPFRCHRSLIGDALLVRGFKIVDIYSLTNSKPHKLTGFAKVMGTKITYPPVGANQ